MARPRKERVERFEVPRDQHDVALDRTSHLLGLAGGRTLKDTLANAYILGVIDAAEVMALGDGGAPSPSTGDLSDTPQAQ